jgi:hypothetical protein
MAHTPDLPESEQVLLRSLVKDQLWSRVQLLHEAGWTLQSIADAFDPPRRRSTIRSWVIKEVTHHEFITATPTPPVKKPRSVRQRPKSPGIPHDEQLRIARLSPLARRYRSRTSSGSASFTANNELTVIAGELFLKGVTVSELARASGVTYRAMKRRVDKAIQ